jgi:hypothetical protein
MCVRALGVGALGDPKGVSRVSGGLDANIVAFSVLAVMVCAALLLVRGHER